MSDFHFKYFTVQQSKSALKVGTDAMVLGALIETSNSVTGLEIGSGTGVISLMLAQKTNSLEIDAIDIDLASFEESKVNFKNSPWSNRLSAFHKDFFKHETEKKYDLIFSNPPFFRRALKSENERSNISKHAQFEFDDFFDKAVQLLNKNGHLWLIGPFDDLTFFIDEGAKAGVYPKIRWTIEGRPNKPQRFVVCFSFQRGNTEQFSLTIRDESGKYSNDYIKLTKEFHNKDL
ncbi:MAG: tRNA1(Val) (adenine(37)-N6)-methyltransferase [Flavobacteriia bacterium]